MDCSLPGSSVHGILQTRILEWVVISFFQGIFPTPGIELWSPALQTDSLPSEPPGWEVKDSQTEGTLISTPSQHWPRRHPDAAIDSPFCGQNRWEAVIFWVPEL